ncbi:MAG TPA: Nramp family divalent metal transporter [Dehalococcoidia bacterium]|nr:Nramp family divalent metal transporter [Dehalococcoidia bacterium]
MTSAAGLRRRLRDLAGELWSLPGPGVITGASDDDPSGIATYSLTGARTGYSLLWTSILTLPLNATVQNMCARIGLLTGSGLASVLRRHYSRRLLLALVVLLFVANTVNIGADIAAVAAGIDLLTGIPERALVAPVAIAIGASEVLVPYRVFASYLKVLTLALFAYIADAFFAGPDWGKALRSTLLPAIHLNASFVTTLVAILGTTISPYLFFWQTSEEVEEMHRRHIARGSEPELRREQIDVDAGMLLANLVFYFIVLTTAATLYPAGLRHITTAREAAEALRPLAGDQATVLFAIGFVGTGLLSIPVLAASAAYAVAEVFDWREGLEETPRQAPQFYLVIALATLIGLGIALSGVGAIRALFIAAVVNGVISPVLIAAILVVSNDERVMGRHRNGRVANLLGGATVVVMGLAALGMAVAFLPG